MSKHAIVRLDNVSGLYNGALVKSAKYFVNDTPTAIDNGNIVVLDGLVEGEREIFKAVAPTATSNNVFLTCGVELIYEQETYHGLEDYVNEAGKVFRAVMLQSGDIFSVTAEALDSTPVVGNYVTVSDGKTTMAVTDTVGESKMIGKVISIETAGSDTYYVISVE
jgi:hypothetical protein